MTYQLINGTRSADALQALQVCFVLFQLLLPRERGHPVQTHVPFPVNDRFMGQKALLNDLLMLTFAI